MKAQITFRSGAQIVVDVGAIEVSHDGSKQQITAVRWKSSGEGDLLLGLVPAEVVAVVALDTRAPEPPAPLPGPNP